MSKPWYALLLGATLIGCGKEGSTDTNETDTDTDSDSDSDTDVEVSDDDIAGANAVEFDDYGTFQWQDDLDEAGDRDFFAISANKGGTYVIGTVSASEGEGDPDTVIRVYGSDEVLIGENDDMPFRIGGTDSGYVFRAPADGKYYVEILEWSDWAGETPSGGVGFDYALAIVDGTNYAEGNEDQNNDNDTIAQELANVETLYDDTEGNEAYSWYADPFSAFRGSDTSYYFTTGDLLLAGDVDTYGFRFTEDEDTGEFTPGAIDFGMYPEIATNLDAVIEVYNGDGELVAETTGGEILPDALGFGYDTGITLPVFEAGDYFFQISDANGAGGLQNWYSVVAYPFGYNLDVVTVHEDPLVEVSYTDSVDTTMTESTSTAGYYYGFAMGRLDSPTDLFDSFLVTEGVEAGKKLTVDCATMGIGSLLDATVFVYDQDGETIARSNDRAGHLDDPKVDGFELPAGTTSLYVVVQRAESVTTSGPGAYYQTSIVVED